MRVSALFFAGSLALVCASACDSSTEEEVGQGNESHLEQGVKMRRYGQIRDVANRSGLENNGYMLAGLAIAETQLSQCLSELPWACPGPSSPDCGGGPVVAGRFDNGCPDGGLGMFQFDAGYFNDTLRVYGNKVLTIEGQVELAVDYVINMVMKSKFISNTETPQKALDWIRAFNPNDRTRRDQWVKTVLRYYNGCQENWSCWNERYPNYNNALQTALNDTGGVAFWVSKATECPGGQGRVVGAIEQKYLAVGGCGSFLGVPTTNELRAPDMRGRYSVFKNGSIYWTEATGAHIVVGAIRNHWGKLGWEAGPLGYPVHDEDEAKDGGRFSKFENGAIYYTEKLGVHEVRGDIYKKWAELKWERGELGYPTSDEYEVEGGRRSDFENGSLVWEAKTRNVTVIAKGDNADNP